LQKIEPDKSKVPDACPHCGNKLSPWQQVLLATDRALVCKNCWYRIILDVMDTSPSSDTGGQKPKNKE
jgi:DNA-directed RNA polymerase subunit RPC12/RpoP